MSALVFTQPGAEIFVPDGATPEAALARTTHLGIMAHADDLEFFAGHGIEACFAAEALWFTGVVLTDGAGSARTGRFAACTDAEMIAIRRAEQREAASIGRYAAAVQLAHPSAVVKEARNPGPDRDLDTILALMRPAVVYLHNPADRHDTHVATFLRSLAALRRLPPERRPARVLGCEGWRGLDWLVETDRIGLPTGAHGDLQERLTAVFASQTAGGKGYDRAVPGRRRANATFHDPHQVDAAAELTFAMDLTPMVADESLDPGDFVAALVRRLADDIAARLARVS